MTRPIPMMEVKPLAGCGCRKFQIDPLGDHLSTCTAHSDTQKSHDWVVDQLREYLNAVSGRGVMPRRVQKGKKYVRGLSFSFVVYGLELFFRVCFVFIVLVLEVPGLLR